jgi:hypothetical protein
MNPKLDKQMEAVRSALGANDPAVAVLGAIGEILGSMQEEIQGLRGKIQSIEEAGVTLRITRLWNFPLILIAGIVLGLTGAGYWMNGHGYTGVFWQHGIQVFTAENSDHLQITVKGPNMDEHEYNEDKEGHVIGFRASYWKVKHADGSQP